MVEYSNGRGQTATCWEWLVAESWKHAFCAASFLHRKAIAARQSHETKVQNHAAAYWREFSGPGAPKKTALGTQHPAAVVAMESLLEIIDEMHEQQLNLAEEQHSRLRQAVLNQLQGESLDAAAPASPVHDIARLQLSATALTAQPALSVDDPCPHSPKMAAQTNGVHFGPLGNFRLTSVCVQVGAPLMWQTVDKQPACL